MAVCPECGAEGAVVEVLARYDDDALGLPVTIRNAVRHHVCLSCGFDGLEIPDVEKLEAALAVARLLVPVRLSGSEIRFLRKTCGLTGKAFAEKLDVDAACLSRWENAPVGQSQGADSDRHIRNIVHGLLSARVPAIVIPPGHLSAMKIADGTVHRIEMEYVRLLDRSAGRKSNEWDIVQNAA